MSIARLWRDQSKTHKARELLAPVYGWFTEGFDTRDLKAGGAPPGSVLVVRNEAPDFVYFRMTNNGIAGRVGYS
jgi:hypothetical protein